MIRIKHRTMNLGKPASHAACFLAGGLATLLAMSWVAPTAARKGDVARTLETATSSAPDRGGSWRGTPGPSASNQAGSSVGESDRLEGAVEVPLAVLGNLSQARGARRIDQPILDENDPVEAALNLTAREKELIQDRWDSVRSRLVEQESRALSATDLEDGSVRLTLPDLTNERRRLASEYGAFLEHTLGSQRGPAFGAIKQIDPMLASNTSERSIVVQVESVGDGLWGYRMTLEDESGTRVWVGDRIPDEIRHLADAAEIFPTIAEAAGGGEQK